MFVHNTLLQHQSIKRVQKRQEDNKVFVTLIFVGLVLFNFGKSYNGKYSYLKPSKANKDSLANDEVANNVVFTNCCGSKQQIVQGKQAVINLKKAMIWRKL